MPRPIIASDNFNLEHVNAVQAMNASIINSNSEPYFNPMPTKHVEVSSGRDDHEEAFTVPLLCGVNITSLWTVEACLAECGIDPTCETDVGEVRFYQYDHAEGGIQWMLNGDPIHALALADIIIGWLKRRVNVVCPRANSCWDALGEGCYIHNWRVPHPVAKALKDATLADAELAAWVAAVEHLHA